MKSTAFDYAWRDAPEKVDMGQLPGGEEQHRLFDALTARGLSVLHWEGAGATHAQPTHPDYQCLRGWCNMLGLGMPISIQCARHWYGKAAQQGHGLARMLASWTSKGSGHKAKYDTLVSWLRLRAKSGDVICGTLVIVGHLTMKVRPHQDPLPLLKSLANEPGGAHARYILGCCHFHGLWGLKNNQRTGFKLILEAAEMGFAAAQEHAGCSYYFGEGVPKSRPQAFRWLGKAVGQGLAEGQDSLAAFLYIELRQMQKLHTLRALSAESSAASHILSLLSEAASNGWSRAQALLEEDERKYAPRVEERVRAGRGAQARGSSCW